MNLNSFGSFFRKHDKAQVKRYRCPICKKSFSESTPKDVFNQKKPYLNPKIYHLLAGGFSQRRSAFVLRTNRKTVIRKFILMGNKAQKILPQLNQFFPDVKSIEFDDLETFEHTKCKPLSVTLVVENETRWILGFRVSQMNAKGHLVKKALKKYGKRKDTRTKMRRELFKSIETYIDKNALIQSDMNPHYVKDVKDFFPMATYKTHRGSRSAVTGQGELKKVGFDPLFSLNHTFAMYRANINRLFRKTWCTTKKPERLSLHIALYSLYHNVLLLDLTKKDAPLRSAEEISTPKEKPIQKNKKLAA